MIKTLAVFGIAMAIVVVGAHAAFAGGGGNNWLCQLFPFLCGGQGQGGGNPAPAPLLAAGIPAFVALGGGALVTRLFRKRRAD
jgi:hypothetical protein